LKSWPRAFSKEPALIYFSSSAQNQTRHPPLFLQSFD
jgi:hypothetical protein